METMRCNKCGKEFKNTGWYKDQFHNPSLHQFTVVFGYGSPRDMESWKYYKCEDCLVEEVESFSLIPDIKEYELFYN